MQNLQPNTILQNGKYRIIKTLGQGGFGITYLAIQSGLDRKVAIKEFFIKELCERDENTSHVTLGTEGGRETAKRYRAKFIKEARNIAKLNHKNIVRIIDIFEENDTSYYVMEYVENGSLSDKVKCQGCLSESVATRYILQVADALNYIHQQKMSHLDVKPANIMLNDKDEIVLIDFGLSKQYDADTGNQTSYTPVGISEGYAPLEQYKQDGIGEFSPKTDIYALGATFFFLLTGSRPPSASDVFEDGLPIERMKQKGVSQKTIDMVCGAMKGKKKDRLDNVATFIKGVKQESTNRISSKINSSQDDASPSEMNNWQKAGNNSDTVIKSTHKGAELQEITKKANIPRRKYSINKIGIAAIISLISIASTILYNLISTGENPIQTNDSNINKDNSFTEKTFTVGENSSFTMIPVEGGTFTMGATPEQKNPNSDEKPTHSVTLSNYYIGEYEVTQALWMTVMGSNPSSYYGPVEGVSWDDCQTFLRKLNSMTGQNFRLPTEAEWEYAARGGKFSQRYQNSGSNYLNDVAWYKDNSDNETHSGGTKSPNELGIYDMSGNVWEWCQDRYGNYSSKAQTNPIGPNSGACRILRGGSFTNDAENCRVSKRLSCTPDGRYDNVGFRLALSL